MENCYTFQDVYELIRHLEKGQRRAIIRGTKWPEGSHLKWCKHRGIVFYNSLSGKEEQLPWSYSYLLTQTFIMEDPDAQ